MDWKKIIAALTGAGLTQTDIASKCNAAQATVSDLATGKTASPGFDLGQALLRLHAELASKKRQKLAA